MIYFYADAKMVYNVSVMFSFALFYLFSVSLYFIFLSDFAGYIKFLLVFSCVGAHYFCVYKYRKLGAGLK